jgi:hypothetical protein
MKCGKKVRCVIFGFVVDEHEKFIPAIVKQKDCLVFSPGIMAP